MHKSLSYLEKSYAFRIYIYFYLASAMGLAAVLFVPTDSSGSEPGSSLSFILCWIVLYAISILYLLKLPKPITKSNLGILAIPLYFIISTIWSLSPSKTATYSSCLLLNTIFAVTLTRWAKPEALFKIILNTNILLISAGLLFYLAGSDLVIYHDIHERENILGSTPIRGFYNHKITAGYYAGLSFFIAIILLDGLKRFATCSLLLFFILLTGSSSALSLIPIGFLLLATLLYLGKLRASRGFIILVFGLIPLSIIIAAINLYEPVLTALGRDTTLTGRTLLWGWGIETALQRPLLGWGYVGYNGSELAQIKALSFKEFENYQVPHFHNSYIQYLVDFGTVIGSTIILLYFFTAIFFAKHYARSKSKSALLISFSIFWIMFSGFFVHTMGRYNDLSMIIFMYSLGLMLKEKKNRSLAYAY
ncbi:O-Antigen ligase [compost metagenome]